MITIEFQGRLGNQLFQYAVLRNISIIKGFEMYYNLNFSWDNQQCLLDKLNLHPSCKKTRIKFLYKQKNKNLPPHEEGGCSTFSDDIFLIQKYTKLIGHFCNEKYFFENKEIIKKELSPKKEENDWAVEYLKKIKKDNEKIVGIHIRRGDFVEIGNFKQKDEEDIIDFINKVLNIIEEKNIILLFFIGGSKNNNPEKDLLWLKEKLHKYKNFNFLISPGSLEGNTIKDYSLLSKTDYSILPNYSSFSWWACYVNNNINKKVYINKNKNYFAAEEFIIL